MAYYIGSDEERHEANIIGIKPSHDCEGYLCFAGCSDGFDWDGMFAHSDEWNDEDTPRSVYVFVDDDLNVTSMEVEFEYDCMEVELTEEDKKYLEKEVRDFLAA